MVVRSACGPSRAARGGRSPVEAHGRCAVTEKDAARRRRPHPTAASCALALAGTAGRSLMDEINRNISDSTPLMGVAINCILVYMCLLLGGAPSRPDRPRRASHRRRGAAAAARANRAFPRTRPCESRGTNRHKPANSKASVRYAVTALSRPSGPDKGMASKARFTSPVINIQSAGTDAGRLSGTTVHD